jgi:hypothetical protein
VLQSLTSLAFVVKPLDLAQPQSCQDERTLSAGLANEVELLHAIAPARIMPIVGDGVV